MLLDDIPIVTYKAEAIDPEAALNAKNVLKTFLTEIQEGQSPNFENNGLEINGSDVNGSDVNGLGITDQAIAEGFGNASIPTQNKNQSKSRKNNQNKRIVELRVETEQLETFSTLVSRTIPNTKVKVNTSKIGLLGAMSTRLPNNPFGRYLNLWVLINPSERGLSIESVRIGQISIPGALTQSTLRILLDLVLGNQQGTQLLDSIHRVTMEQRYFAVSITPPSDLQLLKENVMGNLKKHRDILTLAGEPDKIRHYYAHIVELSKQYHPSQTLSLAKFIGPVFEQAKKRSDKASAADENQAAIMALAIYFGHEKFELLLGNVRTAGMRRHIPLNRVVLADRNDLRLHFIFSAAFEILGNKQGSEAIGEFKELLDANRGGSGFSFPDLAADMAGIEFARWATDKQIGAWQSQFVLSSNQSESAFFPSIEDLPEGLTEREFKQQYGNTQSRDYQIMVDEINRRINALSLYRARR